MSVLDLLSARSIQEMWTVQYSDDSSGFGIGFHVSDHNGLLRIGHAGMIYGYSTRVYALPDQELGVAVVANLDAVNSVVDRIAAYALDLVLASKSGNSLPSRPTYALVDSITAREVDGAYGEDIVLTERNGKLWIEKNPVRMAVRQENNEFVTDGRLDTGITSVYRMIHLYLLTGVSAVVQLITRPSISRTTRIDRRIRMGPQCLIHL